MKRLCLFGRSMLVLLLMPGCASVGGTQSSGAAATGELWYVKNVSLFGLVLDTSVWHCTPPKEGSAKCREAVIVDGPPASVKSPETPAWSPAPDVLPGPPAGAQEPPLWRAAARSANPVVACEEVNSLLDGDEDCVGEQCRAPLELAKLYIVRCEGQPAPDFGAVVKLRALWRERVKGDGGECVALLREAIRDKDAAREYEGQCLGGREPGNLEKVILDGRRRPGAREGEPDSGK